MNIRSLLTPILIFIAYWTQAQQFQELTSDDFNNFNHNPSLINIHEQEVYGIRYHNKLMNLKNSYEYFNLYGEYSWPYKDIGIGLNLERETANGMEKYDVGMGYNYKLKLDKSGHQQLNMGISVNYLQFGFSPEKFIVQHLDDPFLPSLNEKGRGIYAGMGLSYIYRFSKYSLSHKKYENEFLLIGISHKNLLATTPTFDDIIYMTENHYYINLQGKFKISSKYSQNDLFIEPHLMVSSQQTTFNQILLALNFSYNNQFQFGVYGNLNKAIGINLGYKLTEWKTDYTPFVQTSFGISGINNIGVLGPSLYVSLGVTKNIKE